MSFEALSAQFATPHVSPAISPPKRAFVKRLQGAALNVAAVIAVSAIFAFAAIKQNAEEKHTAATAFAIKDRLRDTPPF